MSNEPSVMTIEGELSLKLDRAYLEVEQHTNAIIVQGVRNFMYDMILESLVYRKDEWSSRANVDLSNMRGHEQAIAHASQVVIVILERGAETPDIRNDERHVTLSAVQRQICLDWCNFFPFCR